MALIIIRPNIQDHEPTLIITGLLTNDNKSSDLTIALIYKKKRNRHRENYDTDFIFQQFPQVIGLNFMILYFLNKSFCFLLKLLKP